MAIPITREEYEKRFGIQPNVPSNIDTSIQPKMPKEKKTFGQKVTNTINSIFPGKKVGEAIGTLGGYIGSKNKEFYDTSAPAPKQVVGDIAQGAAFVGGMKLPAPKGVLKGAGQLAGLSAVSGAGGAAAQDGNTKDIFSSAMLSGTIGAGLGLLGGGAGKVTDALTKKAPSRIYNTAIKTPLQDTKKAIMYNGKTLGEELVKRGVTGNDDKLFKYSLDQIRKNEDKLQNILSNSKQTLSRKEIEPYLDDLVKLKETTPGLADDVEKVRAILKEFPENIPISQANQIKRNLYQALDDVAFKIDPNLSTKKEAMKAIAKGIKSEIEKKTAKEAGEGVVKGINQELGVFGRLKDRSLDKIARTNKNNLLGLGDITMLGSGALAGALTSGGPGAVVGAIAAEGTKKALQSTKVMTNAAVKLDQLGKLIDKLPTDSAGRISKTALIRLLGANQGTYKPQ